MRDDSWDAPIFIGGLSYSGKTQLRQLLEAHSHVSFQRRTGLWAYSGKFGDLSIGHNRRQARQALEAANVAPGLEPDWDLVFEEFERGEPAYARLFGIVNKQHAETLGRTRWGEQYGNIVNHSSEIFSTFRKAKIIHMIRHPRGRLARMEGRRRRPGWMGLEAAAGIDSLRLAKEHLDLYPNRYKVLTYEALRDDPMGSARRMLEWIDEPYEAMIHSSQRYEVKFDTPLAESPDVGKTNRSRAFAVAAAPGWPIEGISSYRTVQQGERSWGLLLTKFPLNAMMLWYRLNRADKGENR